VPKLCHWPVGAGGAGVTASGVAAAACIEMVGSAEGDATAMPPARLSSCVGEGVAVPFVRPALTATNVPRMATTATAATAARIGVRPRAFLPKRRPPGPMPFQAGAAAEAGAVAGTASTPVRARTNFRAV